MRPLKPVLLGVVSFAVILFSWEAAVRLGWLNPFFTSQPTAIAAALAREAGSGELARSAAVSLREFIAGFGAAIIVGMLVSGDRVASLLGRVLRTMETRSGGGKRTVNEVTS